MWSAKFIAVYQITEFRPAISDEIMAIAVMLKSFDIFGALLWVRATCLTPPMAAGYNDVAAPIPDRLALPSEGDGKRFFVLAEVFACGRSP